MTLFVQGYLTCLFITITWVSIMITYSTSSIQLWLPNRVYRQIFSVMQSSCCVYEVDSVMCISMWLCCPVCVCEGDRAALIMSGQGSSSFRSRRTSHLSHHRVLLLYQLLQWASSLSPHHAVLYEIVMVIFKTVHILCKMKRFDMTVCLHIIHSQL